MRRGRRGGAAARRHRAASSSIADPVAGRGGGDNRGLFVFRDGDNRTRDRTERPERRDREADRGPEPTRGFGNQRDSGRWTLLAQHQSGSLEAAVAATRRRNLGISFGMLMLLSVSVVMLTVSSRRAQRLARQQMEFVAGVSHELRTPVAVIRSAARTSPQGVVGGADRVKRYGQMIGREARRLGDMVERVLQYAGIESGR